MDLGEGDSYTTLEKILNESNPDIRILVSNAGVARNGPFYESDLQDQMDMINLNVKVVVAITRLCLPYMEKGSFIVETSSVTAFIPVQSLAVYSATKTFDMVFSRTIREELKPRGINVLALCPGNMESEMNVRGMDEQEKTVVEILPFLDMEKVARASLKAAQRGRAVYTPGAFYKILRVISKVIPQGILLKFARE